MGQLGLSLGQNGNMLPRRIFRHAASLIVAVALGAGLIAGSPAQAVTKYTPPVSVQSLAPNYVAKSNFLGKKTIQVISKTSITPFSIVGLTWQGAIPSGTTFSARVREAGVWSAWNELHYSDDHGVNAKSAEAKKARTGTDPLMTAVADGIEVRMVNRSGKKPTGLKVELIGSNATTQDRALLTQVRSANSIRTLGTSTVTPAGGVVPRPNIVTRAQWGADETWRDPVPKMGTTIVAGFIHHTASTNNYSPEQAPAQMRALYAYYTKSLKYADMAYNFLVDQYGTVYEGRNACTYGDVNPCDGPSLPGIGAHTAGLNVNTFAISAIGNYDTKEPSNPGAMVESIASLMAWKLAPYGLDPNANASMVSSDTSGLSKYSSGMTAVTPVISGHRDVGKTACPGRYLYPLIPQIRARATELLAPVIHGVSVAPKFVENSTPTPVNVAAIIPATGVWNVTVTNAATGAVLKTATGTQTETSTIGYAWDRTDAAGAPVAPGRYIVSVGASVGATTLPTVTSEVVVDAKLAAATAVTYKRAARTKANISWTNPASVLPVLTQSYRVSTNGGKTWTKWKKTSRGAASATLTGMKKGKKYVVQVKAANELGESPVTSATFKMK